MNVRAGEPHRSGLWPLAPLIVFALVSLTVGVVARNSNGVVDPSDYLQLFFTDPIHLKVWFASAAFVLACFQVATATAIYGRLRFLPTPHVPHNWESGLWFDETTSTLFAGDLLTHVGDGPAVTTESVVTPAIGAEAMFHAMSCGPDLVPTVERLAALDPTTLALMHGSSFSGDGSAELRAFGEAYASVGPVPAGA